MKPDILMQLLNPMILARAIERLPCAAQDEERSQCRVEPFQRFPCTLRAPSPSPPSSVHRLRPADIQLVAALGDSITAGVGARANSVLDIFTEYRGVSFSSGGQVGRQHWIVSGLEKK